MTRLARLAARCSILVVLALLTSAACRMGALGFAIRPAEAKRHAEDFLGGIALRFTNVHRTPKFAGARVRLGKNALSPSRIADDTSVWTGGGADGSRSLAVQGAMTPAGQYVFDARADAPLPTRPGDSRHTMQLKPLAEGQYEWNTGVDQAVGTLPSEALDQVLGGLLRAIEVMPEADIRREYRVQFARTTAALGRLFTLDTLRSQPHREGGRMVELSISLHPDRLERTLPAFAAYVRKYVAPAGYRWTLRDRTGARWLVATAKDARLEVHLRTAGGVLLPFEGPPRRMPDALRLEGDVSARVMLFNVGASDIVADFTHVRAARERGWHLRFQQEPDWHLPLASRHLIKAPLRRPFEQGGTTIYVFLRETEGGQTHLGRRIHIAVQESAVVRWIGALGATAMSDFAGVTEREENRFIAEVFWAMREDSSQLLTRVAD